MSPEQSPGVPLHWVPEIGSTQRELVARARTGAAAQALASTHQTNGHGRRGRVWVCPPGAGLALSLLLRPQRAEAWSWLPLLGSVAVAEALEPRGLGQARVKWPNDVLVGSSKLAGIIAERVEAAPGGSPAFVLGIGLNLQADGLPAGATSLASHGVHPAADSVAASLVVAVTAWLTRWEIEPTVVAAAYRSRCDTLGRDVDVFLPDGTTVSGVAVDVDDAGRLCVEDGTGVRRTLAAGDVVHVRRQ